MTSVMMADASFLLSQIYHSYDVVLHVLTKYDDNVAKKCATLVDESLLFKLYRSATRMRMIEAAAKPQMVRRRSCVHHGQESGCSGC